MKILFIANLTSTLYLFRKNVLASFTQQGQAVYAAAPADGKVAELSRLGITHFDLPLSRRGLNPLQDLTTFLALYKLIRTIKPDAIFTYTIKPVIWGSLAAGFRGIKNIAVIPGFGHPFLQGGWKLHVVKILYKVALRFASQVWFINEEDRAEFVRMGLVQKEKTFTLACGEGIDTRLFRPAPPKQDGVFRFLFCARILREKGIAEFIEAAGMLRQKYGQEVEFWVIGPIDETSDFSAAELEAATHIRYLGAVRPDEMPDTLAEIHCSVLPSYREGLGKVLLEAGAMEIPVIASDVPGCRAIVEDGMNGFLCRPQNAADLAEKMEKMLTLEPAERARLGRAGRERAVRLFDDSIVIETYNRKLRALMDLAN